MDKVKAPPPRKMPDRVRALIERMGQRYASSLVKDGFVLWDGSLTQTIDMPMQLLRDSIKLANEAGNSIIAVSKRSWLELESGERVVGLLDRNLKPC